MTEKAEQQRDPSSNSNALASRSESVKAADNVVDWDGSNDPEMPMNWPTRKKAPIVIVVTLSRFLTTFASSMMSPALTLTLSIYMVGYAIGPLLFAPLSEVYGRSRIYHTGHIWYTIVSVGCALSPNTGALLVFRLLAGFTGGVPVANAGGTIADMIPRNRHGLLAPITNSGPGSGRLLAETKGWRWIFWLMTILSGVTTIVSFILLQETYSPVLLQRKAAQLRRETGNQLLHARGNANVPTKQKVLQALRWPAVLLCTHPLLMLGSVYMGFVYGVTYLLFTSIPLVFRDLYGWSEGRLGLAPLGVGIGSLLALLVTGRYSDRMYVRQQQKLGHETGLPECRLFFLFPATIALPFGLILYGWTAQFQTHWILPIIGSAIFGGGMIFAFNSVHTYLVDVFSKYAASALAAVSFIRCISGGALPLCGPRLYERLGYGWESDLSQGHKIPVGMEKSHLVVMNVIMEEFKDTPYAFSSLSVVGGGLMNFTYRGYLMSLCDDPPSVIVKHAEAYWPGSVGISVPTDRCFVEQTMLHAVGDTLPAVMHDFICVRTPQLYHFSPKSHTIILENMGDNKSLDDILNNATTSKSISSKTATSIGRALGIWAASFHNWTRKEMKKDVALSIRKHQISHEFLDKFTIGKFLANTIDPLVRRYILEEQGRVRESLDVVHGDLSTRNIVPQNLSPQNPGHPVTLAIVDWETCRYGSHAEDIALMMFSLYKQHYLDSDNGGRAMKMINGFIRGYGRLDQELAFKIAIRVVICLFAWTLYRPEVTKDDMEEITGISQQLIIKGSEKDQAWLEKSLVGCLFGHL
ncbi:hypothetical protein PENFLA_c002G06271 [Penicillium flavigenum]|uniref:Major facilitator superfamily (MFS) profile domain-containing protein n=1 Tax=Penicillium flavigenum TaxID=254877 RepID=A0A1V6TY83_9EURO|nr:hypothetical protein PENFLA_c002G06271 [Penicillium flavigenum]